MFVVVVVAVVMLFVIIQREQRGEKGVPETDDCGRRTFCLCLDTKETKFRSHLRFYSFYSFEGSCQLYVPRGVGHS